MSLVFLEKRRAFRHPGIQAVRRMPRDLAHDVQTILQPSQLAAGRRRKDGDLAVFALVAVLRYVLAMVSETSCSVVW